MASSSTRIPRILPDVLNRLDLRLGITSIQQRRRWTGRIDDDLHYLGDWCLGMFPSSDIADD
jgi:hypothetical protein